MLCLAVMVVYLGVFELMLQTVHPCPATLSNKCKRFYFNFNDPSIKKLKIFSLNNQTNLFMMLLTALNIFLIRSGEQKNTIVRTTFSNGINRENEGIPDFFVNILPLSTVLDLNMNYEEALKKTSRICFELKDTQYAQLPVEANNNLYEMIWNFYEEEEYLRLGLDYSTDRCLEENIAEFVMNFQTLLQDCIENSNKLIHQLKLLSQQEQSRIFHYNYGPCKMLADLPISHYIEVAAKLYPNNIALSFKDEKLTYENFNKKANQLARTIIKINGRSNNTVIGIMMERSIDMIIVFIALTKSGFTYLPLDPTHSIERLEYMINHSGAVTVITQKHLSNLENFSPNIKEKFRFIEDLTSKMSSEFTHNLNIRIKYDDPAYIVYTRGSTDRPLGVTVSQRNLLNVILTFENLISFCSKARLLSITAISVDIFGLELFLPLATGGELILCDNETARNPVHLVGFMNSVKPNVMQATPSLWSTIVEHIRLDRNKFTVLSKGEAFSELLSLKLQEISHKVLNIYGSVETTMGSTVSLLESKSGAINNIGKPINNTSCYVLDQNLNLVPLGCIGELYIGGLGVAKGYYKSPALTKERFISNPFFDQSHQDPIIYKTGDLVRYNNKGVLEYKGPSSTP